MSRLSTAIAAAPDPVRPDAAEYVAMLHTDHAEDAEKVLRLGAAIGKSKAEVAADVDAVQEFRARLPGARKHIRDRAALEPVEAQAEELRRIAGQSAGDHEATTTAIAARPDLFRPLAAEFGVHVP